MDKAARWFLCLGYFAPEIDTKAMMPRAIVAKVAYVPGTAFYADGFGSWSMRLSYCYPTPDRIRQGIAALGKVVEQEMERRGLPQIS